MTGRLTNALFYKTTTATAQNYSHGSLLLMLAKTKCALPSFFQHYRLKNNTNIHISPTPKSHLVNKRFEGLLDRMRPNFQCFRIPFHFTLLYPDITAHCGCTSTHSGRNLSLNENSKSLPQAVLKSGNALEILLLNIDYFGHVTMLLECNA